MRIYTDWNNFFDKNYLFETFFFLKLKTKANYWRKCEANSSAICILLRIFQEFILWGFFFVELDLKYYSNLAATLIHHLGQFRLILYWVTKIWCQKNKINTTRLWSSEALKSVLITAKKIRRKRKKSLNGFWSPAAIHTSLFFIVQT